ncbi:MAG: hypothetical protein IKT96_04665 [Paludibacteraceae bacterium]|nr:hypothetical protein [Paludibacteraceae bacterium]
MGIKRYIHVTGEQRNFLIKAFKTNEMSVWRALNYINDSELSLRIRSLALQRGGIAMVMAEEAETLYDADGYMRQYFPNGVLIEGNKTTGYVAILKDGKEVAGFDNPTITQLEHIQQSAMRL